MHALLHDPPAVPASIIGWVCLDSAPVAYSHSHEAVFAAMQSVTFDPADANGGSAAPSDWRRALDTRLARAGVADVSTRQFILANNVAVDATSGRPIGWRCNVPTLARAQGHVMDWTLPAERINPLPGLVIGGSQSTRLTAPGHADRVRLSFPGARLHMLDGGHFIQNSHAADCAHLMASYIAERVATVLKPASA